MADTEQFTRLWTQAQPAVAAYLSAHVPDFREAEDLLQDVAVVLLRKFAEYDATRSFAGWALGVARYEVLSSRRSHARSFLSFRDSIQAACEELAPELQARTHALQECLKMLKGRALQIVKLRYEQAATPQDIAGRLDMQAGAVRVALTRVRAVLQECIDRRIST